MGLQSSIRTQGETKVKEFTQDELMVIINCLNDERFRVRNQLREDGLSEERKASINKEVKKLTSVLNKVYKAFGV